MMKPVISVVHAVILKEIGFSHSVKVVFYNHLDIATVQFDSNLTFAFVSLAGTRLIYMSRL